jgi:hypothetical protein
MHNQDPSALPLKGGMKREQLAGDMNEESRGMEIGRSSLEHKIILGHSLLLFARHMSMYTER